MSESIEQAPKLATPADVASQGVLVGFDDVPAAPSGQVDDLCSRFLPNPVIESDEVTVTALDGAAR